MTSRLRSGTSIPKERSKATFLGSDTFYYEPEDGTGKGYGRAKHENSYRFGDFREACHESNGRRYSEETEEDPDFLYKRSKDRFGSWDIGDIAGDTSRRPKDGKFERTIAEKSKNILGPREEERNGPRRDGDTTDKMRKEKKLDSSRNGTFLGESLKIRRNGESEKKASFPSSSVDGLPVSSVDDTTIDRTRTSEENDVEGDPRHPRHHRHRHRRRYIFDGAFGDDDLPEDASCKETSRDIDRRRSGNVEKVSRSYEHLIADKDSSILRGEEERTPRYAAAQVASDETNDERNDVVRDVEDRDFEGEEHDPRGLKENSSRKSNRYAIESPRKRTTFNDVVVQEGEDEGTGLEDNARRAGHSFAYAGQSTEDFDVRIRRYERGLPALGRDSNVSKRAAVYRALDRTPSKRDSSKEHDRDAIGRNSFSDVGASRKSSTKEIDSTATTTRRPTQKDQGNGIPSRNLIKIDHAGGIMCTIKSRSNDATEGNCFQGESTDLRRKCSFKEQRPELGKVSFETERGEIPDERSSFRDRRTHGGTSDRIFLRLEKAGDERKRTFLYESPSSSFDRISSDNQKRRVSTSNERNAKNTESAKTTTKSTTGRRRRISFKDRELDRPERRDSYADKDSNEDETIRRSDCSFDEGFETSEFDRNNSVNRERNGRYRLKKTIDGDRRDVDSRAYTPKEHAASSEKKYERHSEVLTPPRGRGGGGGVEDPIRSNETWREDNRLFATRYLRENGRATVRKDNNVHGEGGRDSGPDLADVRSISVNGPRQDRANNRIGPDTRGGVASTVERNGTTIVRILTEAGETTSSRGDLERRRRRCPVQQELCLQHRRKKFDASRYDSEEETVPGEKTGIAVKEEARKERKQVLERDHEEEEEEEEEVVVVEVEDEVERDHEEEQEEEEENDDGIEYRQNFWRRSRRNDRLMPGIAGSAPSRRLWNYREGGVLITDVEEGQPCLQCGEACPGFSPHIWRKNCTSCKCPREDHDVCHEEWASVRSRLGLKADETSNTFGFSDPRERGLAWAPPGLPPYKVDEYFSVLPEISVPRLGTPGERYRDRQLAFQLPKQDLARAYCRYLDPKHASSADDFMAARNEIALDIGTVQEVLEEGSYCGTCQEPLKYDSLAVSASKLGLLYHPACFRCADCKELLVDLAYCVHEDVIFCERHYAEQLKPRCSACDELIFSGEYTKAMNKDWHSGHFCCWQCDESLTGQRYVLRDEHPYCIKCYESIFANGCEECNKIIGIDSKDLSYKDKHWHEACFLCNRCRVSLVDKQFGSKVDKIYCGNCYDAQFASRCDGCGEIFRAGTKKMEYKTRQWHEKCFCCVVCKNPIGTKSFIPREQEIYCASCYEDKFATRCVKCNKIITSGGVTYKNEPWHRDCFTCSHCNNSLAGQRFTSRDDKPYCADCFGELFAKRCTACSKPITGIGGTRFISFEDRHWHNECFICAGCKTSLVGRGFITDGDDIICPECAKAKLM